MPPLPEFRRPSGLQVHEGWSPTPEEEAKALALSRGEPDPTAWTSQFGQALRSLASGPSPEAGESPLGAGARWVSQYALPGGLGALAMARVPKAAKAPAEFFALQRHPVDPLKSFYLYNLLEDIPKHPARSTVSDVTLRQAGHFVPGFLDDRKAVLMMTTGKSSDQPADFLFDVARQAMDRVGAHPGMTVGQIRELFALKP